VRVDSGDIGDGFMGYLSYLHQNQRAWDFDGYQHGEQLNLKVVKADDVGRFTFYADWNSKVEPNEDSISVGNQQTAAGQGFIPYTRPFLYPNLAGAIANLTTNPAQPGTPPVAQGNNFSNYHSAAQREDALTYAQYDWNVMSDLTWSNQVYFHHVTGRGIVAGPVNNAGLPGIGMSQDPIEYNSLTHHTNLDTYERIVPEDVKGDAVVLAASVWYVANLDQMIPRFAKDKMPAPVVAR